MIDSERTWRGGEAQLAGLVEGLIERGWRVELAAPEGSAIARRLRDRVERLWPVAFRGAAALGAPRRLREAIRQARVDLVHAHAARAHAAAAIALVGLPAPPPLVVTRRVDFPVGRTPWSRWQYRRCDHLIAISEGVRRVLVAGGVDPERVTVVPSGIDLDKFRGVEPLADLRSRFGFPEDALVVGNVAALAPHKAQRVLVAAAAKVIEREPRARFLVVGEGRERARIERAIREHRLEGRVVLAGFRHDVLRILLALDLFVLSSVLEGLGTSLLDALLAGVPVVATRTGGIPEAIRHEETGLLVPPGDPEALARGILRMLRDRALRDRCRERGRVWVRRFGLDRMVEGTLSVYRFVLGERGRESEHDPCRVEEG
jgi:glycosyltransferase involved in cell wall biosynthesis